MNWTLCLTALTLTLGGTTPELNDQTYEHWRDYILPKKAELSW